ncbi:DNA-invertase hin (plasmid) [Aquicella lusitana]|uniref:Resolvase-like protein n=1 Tax=Aquicella lusitana TaxID=254246 RepID=A0A370G146_9COXI|nr:resolvase-like protein [Aquicella lusitana]VVC73122.1 DNA-invertase hin [Aquicella lusitana]VVC74588.1 DNA-invertase hin [Aquicella lusitana]
MKIGYVRVSATDQYLRMQEYALKSAGCEEIYTDVASGAKLQPPGLDKALNYLREGDMLIVWKLDRLRSIQHLIQTITMFQEKKFILKAYKNQLTQLLAVAS